MNYIEYKEMIKNIPYSENLEYKPAFLWLHPERLPVGVVSIGEDAKGVIKIPNRAKNSYGKEVPVVAISKDAFTGQDKITDVVLPSGIEHIPAGAFSGCSSLKRITIPKSLKVILREAFDGCVNLEDIYYEGTMEEWKEVNIVHHKLETEYGPQTSENQEQEIKTEILRHIPGNDAIRTCNIHFHCECPKSENEPAFKILIGDTDVTNQFKKM